MTDSTTPTDDSGASFDPGSGLEVIEKTAPTGRRGSTSRRWWVVAGLVVGIVGLAAGVAVAAVVLWGGATEEDAARGFLEALESEDVLGIGEQLLPGERITFFEPMLEWVDEAERLGFVDDVDLDGVQGLDLAFDDLTFDVERLADDLAWVAISGTFTLSIESGDLPIGSLLERLLPPDWQDQVGAGPQPSEFGEDFGLAVVARDGDWHVSLAHTIGEAVRRDAGLEFPAEPGLPEPSGAASPEEAMERAVLAVADVDLRGLIDVLDPDDTEAVRRYSALFMDDWDDGVAEFWQSLSEAGLTYSVAEVVVGSEERDDATVAWIESIRRFSLRFDVPEAGGLIEVSLEDDCLRVLLPEAVIEGIRAVPGLDIDVAEFDGITCVDLDSLSNAAGGGDQAAVDEEMLYGMPVFGPFLEQWQAGFENMGDAGAAAVQFHMTEHDGRWFVSPFRTYHRWAMAGIRTLDQDLLVQAIEDFEYAADHPEEFEQEMLKYVTGIMPALGVPLYGPEVLAPFADTPLVFIVWGDDVDAVVRDIDERFGAGLVAEVIPGPELYARFFEQFGPNAVEPLTPETFPFGISMEPLDIDTLIEIFNLSQVVDLIPTAQLGLPGI